MTCGNPRCQHEFCWLCLHDWTSATHDASFCTGRTEASHSEVLASVERQIRSNWAQQAHDTRPAEDTYAEEVLQRFRVALTTRLESDPELLSAGDGHGENRLEASTNEEDGWTLAEEHEDIQDDMAFVDGAWNENAAVFEQKDPLDTVVGLGCRRRCARRRGGQGS